MKFALLLLTVLAPVLPLSAQTPGGTQEIVVVTATSPMILAEQKEVLAASSALIAASVDLRADGTARTTHHIGTFTTRIELTGLAISEIVKTPVTRADAEKGIAALGEAHHEPGDTVGLAAQKTGLDAGTLEQIVEQIGGEGSLARFSQILDQDHDGNPFDDIVGVAGKLFGKS